jgi:hypothetical protein
MADEPYCPTVLIVDDDRAYTDYLRQKFHKETSVGVVVANTLKQGRQLLTEQGVHIDGIVADLYFGAGTDDPEHQLFFGTDLLSYSRQVRPAVRRYVSSFFAEREELKKRAAAAQVPEEHWFQKAWQMPGTGERAPWHEIERHLIKVRLESDKQVQ